MKIGYFLSSEEWGPRDLVALGVVDGQPAGDEPRDGEEDDQAEDAERDAHRR